MLTTREDLKYKTHTYTSSTYTIPNIISKYDIASSSKIDTLRLPSPEDDAIHMFTSSASSVAQLKLVPIHHGALLRNAARELESWRIRSGETEGPLKPTRVLGWGPFSHIMAIAHDLTVFTALPGGCYVFGAPPATYPIPAAVLEAESKTSEPVVEELRLPLKLLRNAARAHADVFAGVPWMYARFREACKVYPEYLPVLKEFRQLVAGGALAEAAVLAWCQEHDLRLEISLGMTECGGISIFFLLHM